MTKVERWIRQRGWRPFDFQRDVWRAVGDGRDGLLHATTGSGKTYAVWLAALQQFVAPRRQPKVAVASTARAPTAVAVPRRKKTAAAPPLTVLWLTPMLALAADTARALNEPLAELAPDWTLGLRTGDTTTAQRAAQARRLPTALVTTPESLSVLLSRADAEPALASVRMVVVDEWHELLGNKRGVQVQLALARLRQWRPDLITWGLSATLGNLDDALDALAGRSAARPPPLLVQGRIDKPLRIDSLIPAVIERFPWSGHLGLTMLPQVVAELTDSTHSLVFTNTRAQSEVWYQALLDARPDWAGQIALHHGSLDRDTREWVETSLKEGRLKAVVCTSSLDLGVDFLPVERVLQIGSAKGVARLLQRAGRSGHAPGRVSRVTLVPTHSLELLEAAAARAAVQAQRIEARRSPDKPLDVLVQHLVTVALGGGFVAARLLVEVRSAHAYRDLSDAEWAWCLDFVSRGGSSLTAYPEYRRALPDADGVWRVPDARLARRHRQNIGTIVSDASMLVRYWSRGGAGGGRVGTVEEGFIARLRPGDCFLFAGRMLELVRVHEMTAYVRRVVGKKGVVPRWAGGRMPLSSELAAAVREQLDDAEQGRLESPEMRALAPLLALQTRWSRLPVSGRLLAEVLRSREGHHLFLYPFAGRHAHLGLASLIAWRAGRRQPTTFSMACNDYGFELLSPTPVDWPALLNQGLFDEAALLDDLLASLNAGELAQRQFREIARVAGLISQGFPGAQKSNRQLQASSGLFFDVFRQHDPQNLLLGQAEREALRQELDYTRLSEALQRMRADRLEIVTLKRASPFAFPLLIERMREKWSTEKLADRIARMLADLERAADRP